MGIVLLLLAMGGVFVLHTADAATQPSVESYDRSTETLTITGDGAFNYDSVVDTPWASYSDSAQHVVIKGTLTRVGNNYFNGFAKLESVAFATDTIRVVGDNAFYGCTALKDIVLPDTVYRIGKNAFAGCSSVSVLAIPSGVTYIGENAFYGTGITSVTLPAGLTTAANAFRGTAVSEVVFADGLTSLPDRTFRGCTGLKSIVLGADVKQIGQEAFGNCTALSSVTFSSSLTSVGANAFKGCTALSSVLFPSSLTSVGANAFKGCTALVSVIFPTTLAEIGDGAFSGTALTTVKIPAGVSTLRGFDSCTSLTTITFSVGSIMNEIGINALKGSGIVSFIAPSGVMYVRSGAFADCTSLTSVVFPKSVNVVESGAFSGCTALISMDLGRVKTIEDNAFSGCTALTAVTVPSTVSKLSGFDGCSSLSAVTLADPSSVTEVGASAFVGTALTSFVFGENLSSVGDKAFSGTPIAEASFISAVSIGSSAFAGCTSLKTADLAIVVSIGVSVFSGCTSLNNVVFGSSMAAVSETAFENCSSLVSVVLSDGVSEVGAKAFSGCTALVSADMNKAEKVGAEAFLNCSSLESVSMPSVREFGTSEFGQGVFGGCAKLTSFEFAEGITEIPDVFKKSEYIKSVTFPSTTTSVGANAFDGCSSLTEIILKDGCTLTSIGYRTFRGCSGMESFECLGHSLVSIGDFAFESCTSLKSFDLRGISSLGGAFRGCTSLTTAITDETSTFTSLSVTFANTNLESFTVPATVQSMGSAFSKSGIKEVIFAEGSQLSRLNGTFMDCANLKHIDLPDTVTFIGGHTFTGSGIESLHIPASVKTVENYSISGCPNLKEVTGGEGLSDISSSAVYYYLFYNCLSLETIALGESEGLIAYDNALYSKEKVKGETNLSLIKIGAGKTSFVIPDEISGKVTSYKVTKIADIATAGSTVTDLTLGRNISKYSESEGTVGGSNVLGMVKVLTVPEGNVGVWLYGSHLSVLEKLNILGKVTRINGFNHALIDSLIIPDGSDITISGFNYCDNLTSLRIPSSVTIVGDSFNYCKNLKTVVLDCLTVQNSFNQGGLEYLELNGVQNIKGNKGDGCFNAPQLTNVKFGPYLNTIEGKCFTNCNFTSVHLDGSGLRVDGAFSKCSLLKEVYLDDGVYEITDCFDGCDIDKVEVSEDNTYLAVYNRMICSYDWVKLYLVLPGTERVQIPNTVTQINSGAFIDAGAVRYLKISDSVTSLPKGLLDDMNLEELDLGEGVTVLDTSLSSNVLKKITFGSRFTTCGDDFSGCRNLTSLTFGANLQYLPGELPYVQHIDIDRSNPYVAYDEDTGVFYNKQTGAYIGRVDSASATGLVIPDTVRSMQIRSIPGITKEVNYGCVLNGKKVLRTLFTGDGMTSMGAWSIYKATGLQTVILGRGLTSMGNHSIAEISSLSDIYFTGVTLPEMTGYPIVNVKALKVHSSFDANFLDSYVSPSVSISYDDSDPYLVFVKLCPGTIGSNSLSVNTNGSSVSFTLKVPIDQDLSISTDSGTLRDISSSIFDRSNGNAQMHTYVFDISGYEKHVRVSPVTSDVISSGAPIALNKSELSLGTDGTAVLKASVRSDLSDDIDVVWSSDNPTVATVDQEGNVVAVGIGTAYITAKVGDISATCRVTVGSAIESVQLDSDRITVPVGSYRYLTAIVSPVSADVSWRSNNESVAFVDSDGKVYACKPGTCTVTVSPGDVSASCTVTVVSDTSSGISWGFPLETYRIPVGGTVIVWCGSDPVSVISGILPFTTDGDSISAVRGGTAMCGIGLSCYDVTGVSVGTAHLTVTCPDGSTVTCTLSVEDASADGDGWRFADGTFVSYAAEGDECNLTYTSPDGSATILRCADVSEGDLSTLSYVVTVSNRSGVLTSGSGHVVFFRGASSAPDATIYAVAEVSEGKLIWNSTACFYYGSATGSTGSGSNFGGSRLGYVSDLVGYAASAGYNLHLDNITLDASGYNTRGDSSLTAVLSGTIWATVSEFGSDLTVITNNGSVTLSAETVAGISAGGPVRIGVGLADHSTLSADQRKTLGDVPVYSLFVVADGKYVETFAGTAEVTVPYMLRGDATGVRVLCLNSDGSYADVPCSYDSDSQSVSFTVSHFSEYAVCPTSSVQPGPSPTPGPSPDPSPGQDDGSSSSSMVLVAVVVMIVLVAVAAGAVYLKRRKA